jgi:hypothetical protein
MANFVGELSLSSGGTERGKEETAANVALNSEVMHERSNQTWPAAASHCHHEQVRVLHA